MTVPCSIVFHILAFAAAYAPCVLKSATHNSFLTCCSLRPHKRTDNKTAECREMKPKEEELKLAETNQGP
ncbi:hypothetical protein K1719_002226 [Acacia pycnantha]|nr:hypothetical protein K1719_002226 [Acacia pycnantha]